MRANSISNPGVALNRELPTNFDLIQAVAEVASEIEELAPYAGQIAEIVAALPDVTTVSEASELINNLTVTVVGTLAAGSEAEVELVGTELRLKLPAGYNGLSPVMEFTYEPETGDIAYEVTAWKDITNQVINTPQAAEEV